LTDRVQSQPACHAVSTEIPGDRRVLGSVVRQLRVHQWAKNLLAFVPLLAAHEVTASGPLKSVILAFVAMSLCASAIYVVNDFYDLETDRLHPSKRHRPLAAGEIRPRTAMVLAAMLLTAGTTVAWVISLNVLWLTGFYVAVSLAYSHVLKEFAIIDVLTLAGLYTLRVFVGGAAARVELSPWLLAFSMFLFISLAIVKRTSELQGLKEMRQERPLRRGYDARDLDVLSIVGTSAGQMAVLVFALYVSSDTVTRLYRRPNVLWLLCVIIFYWITAVWLKVYRGQMNEDPVVYALKDKPSYLLGLLALAVVYLASR